MRRTTFLYQDGVMLCATARALEEIGVLEASLAAERSVADLCPGIGASGFGYLRGGLRCLAGNGWLAEAPTLDPETTVLRWTDVGRAAAEHHGRYVGLGRFLALFDSTAEDAWSDPWSGEQVAALAAFIDRARDRWGEHTEELVATHLDAALAVPALLWLYGGGRLGERGPDLPENDAGPPLRELLAAFGWLEPSRGEWTPAGRQLIPFIPHLGLVGSYLPLLARLPELYRGEITVPDAQDRDSAEWHVHRELNIAASAAAHGRYFADADGIFRELFDREPLESQPRFIADTGCGDGSWLVHLHRMVSEETLRGRHLGAHPLLMVGVDANAAALDRARVALEAAGVPAVVIAGDIGDPDHLASELARHGLAMEDGLHIRSFIDHDRTYGGRCDEAPRLGWSSGAYVSPGGEALSPADVESDLVAHLRGWAAHVHRHGLVVLEAHCVAPHVARRQLGALHSVTFDAYHAYSHQYPVEHAAFLRCAQHAGLEPATHHERRYPSSRPFVAVSVNRLLAEDSVTLPALDDGAQREDTWQPGPDTDLEDGRALHELLYVDGDLRHPRLWCSAATGFVVAGALDAIEARLAGARSGDVIRVLDYGTGTGLAATELLKACRERAVEARLEQAGASLELHVADLPSSWFAQGHELLRDCAWTRFHSLRSDDGGFRPLLDVTGGRTMDAVMANMVFHLIPPRALERSAAELAAVTAPAGRLLWSSPDLGPAGAYSVLFHDPNRRLRALWLERLDAGARGQDRADRRILPTPQGAADVAAALGGHFTGEVERRTYEILGEDVLRALLVPSNQGEFLPEVEDRAEREALIRELMLEQVLPELQEGPAGTALGLSLQWTLGDFRKGGR